jgi:hypothetical protein
MVENQYYFKYAKNIFSQNGDDGIIEKIFEHLKINDGVVVEFGAWDGIYLSNVYNLWKNKNFSALLIESDEGKANEMLGMFSDFDNVDLMNCAVSPDKGDEYSLDNLLQKSILNITNDNLNLVSIDVDSCDYHIFESLEEYSPKVVVIETKGFDDPNVKYNIFGNGCSLKSVTELAEKKGYTLVCHNGNAYFVRNDLTYLLPDDIESSLEDLHSSISDIDIWQSIDASGNVKDGFRYYLSPEYTSLIENEKKTLIKR